MTKTELIEMLEDLPDNADVRIAVQPNYPFLTSLQNICIQQDESGENIGAVICAGDNDEYTTRRWWGEQYLAVDENGDPLEDEE